MAESGLGAGSRARLRGAVLALARCAAVLVLVLTVVCAVAAAAGRSPQSVLAALWAGSLGSPQSAADSLAQSIPILFTGLAVALAFRCGIWNIGAEGQFLVGMLCAAAVGLAAGGWPRGAAVAASLVAGAAGGALWAGLPAFLRARRGVPEVISTILFNFLAAYLVSYCVQGPLHEPGTDIPRTPLLPASARLPDLMGRSGIHAGWILGLLIAAGLQVLFSRTTWGLQIRATGLGPVAARASGVDVGRVAALTFIASGAVAGLGGSSHVLGVAHQLYIYEPGEPGYGYTGIAAALLGGQTGPGTALAAFFFGALAAGSNTMQREAGVYVQLAYVIQALLIVALLALARRRP